MGTVTQQREKGKHKDRGRAHWKQACEVSAELRALLGDFRQHIRGGRNFRERHGDHQRNMIRRFLALAGIETPGQITKEAVAAYLAKLRRSGYTRKTRDNMRGCISAFARYLIGRGLLENDPCPSRARKWTQPPLPPTIGQALVDFERLCRLNCGRSQLRFNLRVAADFLVVQQIRRLARIGPADVQGYLVGLLDKGQHPHTVRNTASAISRFCGFLVSREVLAANPVKNVMLPKLERRPPIFLTDAEVQKALRIAAEHDIYAEVSVAIFTGLRLGELKRLRWQDVNIQGRKIMVRHSKSKRFRVVPLCRTAVETLTEHRQQTGQCEYVFPGRRRAGDTGMRGHRFWTYALAPLQRAISKFGQAEKGQVGHAWHLFRHSFASLCVRRNVSIFKLSKWLGHSDPRTTLIYAHLADDFDGDVEKID